MNLVASLPDTFLVTVGLLASGPSESWAQSAVAIAIFAMITTIVGVAIYQAFASWRARMSIAREDAYRKLAEESVALQSRLASQQERFDQDVADLRARLAGIERLLQTID